jgi:glycosyltransferase involved in cell wall biosynthesis
MAKAYGASDEALSIEFETKRRGFESARIVQVSTEAERVRLGKSFPDIAGKFIAIPFLVPDVKAIPLDLLMSKVEHSGILHCLFVGHEARRKGLPRVYAALTMLPPRVRNLIHLTVVSGQTDGPVDAPALPHLSVLGALPPDQVQSLFRESDVYLMPSLFESYGLVYLEAMAQGAIPVVPNWEVQREIVDYGNAGIVTSGDPAELALQLERLCDDKNLRIRLALAARQRFEEHFAPAVVAGKFSSMFHRALNL